METIILFVNIILAYGIYYYGKTLIKDIKWIVAHEKIVKPEKYERVPIGE